MQKFINWIGCLAVLIILSSIVAGCATRTTPAPIVNVTAVPSNAVAAPAGATPNTVNGTLPQQGVGSSPVLGSVTPNSLTPTTQVNGQPQSGVVVAPHTNSALNALSDDTASGWIMPTDGNVIQMFSIATKGVDFSGSVGQPIYAVADGKVLYSGNGLAGYGNLIIIRHEGNYLSAYSHNKNNLVSEGAIVKRGQKIATMGVGKTGTPLLHFEVRKSGKPIDPFSIIK